MGLTSQAAPPNRPCLRDWREPNIGYRATQEQLERLTTILKAYEGTHNFHNFTIR